MYTVAGKHIVRSEKRHWFPTETHKNLEELNLEILQAKKMILSWYIL